MTTQSPASPSAPSPAPLPPLGVAVKTIGVISIAMVGSSISSQLVDLAISDIGGGLSISADDASWIACFATMAEVAAIPIAALLARALSLRLLVLCASSLYGLCALASLAVSREEPLLVLRVVQSFCSGTLSVLLFVTVMATLPAGPKRAIGLALFAFLSTAPSAVSASLGGLLTDWLGWRGLYGFDIAWDVLLLVAAVLILRPTPRAMRLSEIDWTGYIAAAFGLCALILFMKQGDRLFWLDSPIIVRAGVVAVIAIPAAVLLFALRRQPLIDLSLLAKPSFGWAVSIATFYRFGLVMTAFVVPQALTRLQGFRLPEIGQASLWMLWPQCLAFPLACLWAYRRDARWPLSTGLLFFAAGAYVANFLTPEWQANDFALSLALIGFGQGLFLVPTLFYATRDVAPQQGPTAAALFNLSRVVGQTFGISAVGSLITYREKFHSAVLVDAINNASTTATARFNALVASNFAATGDRGLAEAQAWRTLTGAASGQAYVLAFADAFLVVALVLAVSAILVLMLPALRAPKSKATGVGRALDHHGTIGSGRLA